MRNGPVILTLALIFGGGLILSSCTRTVYYTPRSKPTQTVKKRPGPPPHAPAHGYRHKHGTTYLIYDSRLLVYRVYGYPGHYFHDGRYYRDGRDGWEICVVTSGPWERITEEKIPGNLKPKKHKTNQRGKENNNGQGHAYGKRKDNWKDSGKSKDEFHGRDQTVAERDTNKNKKNNEEIHIVPKSDGNSRGSGSKGKNKTDAKGKDAGQSKDVAKKADKAKGESTEIGKNTVKSKDDKESNDKRNGKSDDKGKDRAESKDSDKKDGKDKDKPEEKGKSKDDKDKDSDKDDDKDDKKDDDKGKGKK